MPRARRRSATRRAIGPATIVIWIEIGWTVGSVVAPSATRPRDGLMAVIPQNWAGIRSEPPRSLPRPSGVIPVARATASPPDEPPGVRAGSHGFRV